MKLRILSVGHKMPDWIAAGYAEYAKRMPREVRMELVEIKPEPRTSGRNAEQIMAAEAQRILAAVPQGGWLVALDEHGKQPTTRELADHLREWMSAGQDVSFVIGGADGLHASVKAAARQLLALSNLTLPHAMVRVLLAEQLYRAHSLLQNHPYHRE